MPDRELCKSCCIVVAMWLFASLAVTLVIFNIPALAKPYCNDARYACSGYDQEMQPWNCEGLPDSMCNGCRECLIKNGTQDICMPFRCAVEKINAEESMILGFMVSIIGLYVLIL